MNEAELISKYKASYLGAFLDFTTHVVVACTTFYSLWVFKDSVLSFLTIPLTALCHVKTFIIYHDCGHQSYTPNKRLNYALGCVAGIFSFTPYAWSCNHAMHHATVGTLVNKYDAFSETVLHTTRQYHQFSPIKRLVYRSLRSPLFFFTFAPSIQFIIMQRFQFFLLHRLSVTDQPTQYYALAEQVVNNVGVATLIWVANYHGVFCHFLLSIAMAAAIGFMLFHSQHVYNPSFMVSMDKYTQKESGLKGSSFIHVPWALTYFTGGIEYHHIHHMNSKIPGYHLKQYHTDVVESSDMFNDIVQLTMYDCYQNLALALFDEDRNEYVTFEQADSHDAKND